MAKVLSGTLSVKNVQTVKKQHPAGAEKMRCSGCKIGMAVLIQNSAGQKVYRCNRCGRDYSPVAL